MKLKGKMGALVDLTNPIYSGSFVRTDKCPIKRTYCSSPKGNCKYYGFPKTNTTSLTFLSTEINCKYETAVEFIRGLDG